MTGYDIFAWIVLLILVASAIEELAHPTRFERVTFAFGRQAPTTPIAERRITGFLSKAKSHFPAVAQTVGFGPGRSKMLDLSMGVD